MIKEYRSILTNVQEAFPIFDPYSALSRGLCVVRTGFEPAWEHFLVTSNITRYLPCVLADHTQTHTSTISPPDYKFALMIEYDSIPTYKRATYHLSTQAIPLQQNRPITCKL